MNSKSFLVILLCTLGMLAGADAARFSLAASNLAGCTDLIWELPCDAEIQIWYLDGLLPDWQFYQGTGVIDNNNNPAWPTIFTIPSDAVEFKFVVVDDDFGFDDVLGVATALTTEILTGVGGITVKPIGMGAGSGFVHITLRP